MSYFIIDELNKSIHDYSRMIPGLCNVSSETPPKLTLIDERKLKGMLLYENYNGCRYCLKRYHIAKTA